jgi:hypothetical protein
LHDHGRGPGGAAAGKGDARAAAGCAGVRDHHESIVDKPFGQNALFAGGIVDDANIDGAGFALGGHDGGTGWVACEHRTLRQLAVAEPNAQTGRKAAAGQADAGATGEGPVRGQQTVDAKGIAESHIGPLQRGVVGEVDVSGGATVGCAQ